jgi:hypothetical protein
VTKKIDADELFILRDRADARRSWEVRLGVLAGGAAAVIVGLLAQQSCAASSQAAVEVERLRTEQAAWSVLNAPWISLEAEQRREHERELARIAAPTQARQIEAEALRERQKLSQLATCILQGHGAKECADAHYPERVEEEAAARLREAEHRGQLYQVCLGDTHTQANDCQHHVNELLGS